MRGDELCLAYKKDDENNDVKLECLPIFLIDKNIFYVQFVFENPDRECREPDQPMSCHQLDKKIKINKGKSERKKVKK